MVSICQELAEKYRDRAAERRDGGESAPPGADDPSNAAYRLVGCLVGWLVGGFVDRIVVWFLCWSDGWLFG